MTKKQKITSELSEGELPRWMQVLKEEQRQFDNALRRDRDHRLIHLDNEIFTDRKMNPEEALIHRELEEKLLELLKALSAKDMDIVISNILNHEPIKSIAKRMNVSSPSITKRKKKALIVLKNGFNDWFMTEE